MEEYGDSFFLFNDIDYNNINLFRNECNGHNAEMNPLNLDSLPLESNDDLMIFGNLTYDIESAIQAKPKAESTFKILDKLNKFEDIYYNNIISFPGTDIKLYNKKILENNLNLIENTLPGLIICLLFKNNNNPIPEIYLLNIISSRFDELRKPNGSKYKGNINKVFKSTLSSSGMFTRIGVTWIYKEKEAINYVLRITEKLLNRKLDTEKKVKKVVLVDETRSTYTDKKAPKKIKMKIDDVNYKIGKVYGILDDLLNKYKTDKSLIKTLKNPFNNINSSIELVQKIGNDNQCVGILMCFKFFKSIITKYSKLISKHKKCEELLNTNPITDKLDLLNSKIDYIEKYFSAEKKLKKSNKPSINNVIKKNK